MNEELMKIRELLTEKPKSLDEARKVKGVECISWNMHSMEPLTFRLTDGRMEFSKHEIFNT